MVGRLNAAQPKLNFMPVQFTVDNLKDFQKRTQYIKPNTTLPSLAYIKLEYREGKHFLIKNNLRCVCVSLINGIGECPDLLLDEKIFFGFISRAKGDTITIHWDDKKGVFITDGKMWANFHREKPEDFPKTPDYSQAKSTFIFTREHLDAIAIAKNFILDTDTAGNFRFIHTGGEFIAALHTGYFYVNNKFKDLPVMLIDSEIASIITAGIQFEVAIQDNHYFFQYGSVVYIFTRYEGNSPNIKAVIWDKLQTPGKDFQFAKENIIDFCDLSNIVTESELAHCSMYKENAILKLIMRDADKNRAAVRDVPMTGDLDKFSFDSRSIVNSLRSIPYESFKSKTTNNCWIISEPTGKEYFCFIGLNLG